jgi:hypothetical protein
VKPASSRALSTSPRGTTPSPYATERGPATGSAPGPGSDQIEHREQLRRREVAVVLEGKAQAALARRGGDGRERGGGRREALARDRSVPEPRARRHAADDRAAEPLRDLEPLDELRQGAGPAAELEAVGMSPGEHDLQRPSRRSKRRCIQVLRGAEEAGLERDAVDLQAAGVLDRVERAPGEQSRRG